MPKKAPYKHSALRRAAAAPVPSRAPRAGYLGDASAAAEYDVAAGDMAWSLRAAHDGMEGGQVLIKPRNTSGSPGQLWDDQRLLLRMGPAENCTQRHMVLAVQSREGTYLHASDAGALHGVSVELLGATGTMLGADACSVSFTAVRVTGGGPGGVGSPLSLVFSDGSAETAFHRDTPGSGCECTGEDAAISRAWAQLSAMAEVGALPALATGLVLLLVPLSALPAGKDKDVVRRLGASFPVPPAQRPVGGSATLGPTADAAVQQAVSLPFAVRSHVGASKSACAAKRRVLDCYVLPLPAHMRAAVAGVPRVSLAAVGDDTLCVTSPVTGQLRAGVLRFPGSSAAHDVWTCTPGGDSGVLAVVAGGASPCRMCGEAVQAHVAGGTLARVRVGGAVETCVVTAVDGAGEHVVVCSLQRAASPAVGGGCVWVYPAAQCRYAWGGAGAAAAAAGGGGDGGSVGSRSSGKRSRSPDSDAYASEADSVRSSPKAARSAPAVHAPRERSASLGVSLPLSAAAVGCVSAAAGAPLAAAAWGGGSGEAVLGLRRPPLGLVGGDTWAAAGLPPPPALPRFTSLEDAETRQLTPQQLLRGAEGAPAGDWSCGFLHMAGGGMSPAVTATDDDDGYSVPAWHAVE